MDLECVASFLALAEAENFGRAAMRLHVGSPALTKRIQRLERQVGVALVEHRASGGFELTAAGRRFLRQAEPLLLQARITRAAAQSHSGELIRLGVPGHLGDSPGIPELKVLSGLLRRTMPEVRLDCIGIPYPFMTQCLLQHRIDVAWTTSGIEHPDLESMPLTKAWRIGVVPVDHEFADAVALNVDDFAELPMLHNPEIPSGVMSLGCLGDFRPLSEALLVTTGARQITEVLQDVTRGLGVAVVPAPLLPLIRKSGLRAISLVGLMPFEIHAVRRRSDTRNSVFELLRLLGPVATDAARIRQ